MLAGSRPAYRLNLTGRYRFRRSGQIDTCETGVFPPDRPYLSRITFVDAQELLLYCLAPAAPPSALLLCSGYSI